MAPYLSFVFTGSNAQYGGDFIARMQACLDNLYLLAEKHGLDCDVTVVEWNPPLDRQRIYDAVYFNSEHIETRVLTVPKEVHDSVPNPHGEKFFEYWAKNVGIRRASGKFILSTNPDNLYSESLIARLAQHDLDEGCFYRVNRSDIRGNDVIATHYAGGSVVDGKPTTSDSTVIADPGGTYDYPELGRREVLHFNASGDFILMTKSAWEDIHGHPEVPYSLTVDGHTVFLAAKAGLRQVILPQPMYHQNHGRTDKYYPPWNDKTPYGVQNDKDWGFPQHAFATRCL